MAYGMEFWSALLSFGWKGYYAGLSPNTHEIISDTVVVRKAVIDGVRLPVKEAQFDAAFCLCYDEVENPETLLAEMQRVARCAVVLSELNDFAARCKRLGEAGGVEVFQEAGTHEATGMYWATWRRDYQSVEPRVRRMRIPDAGAYVEEIR